VSVSKSIIFHVGTVKTGSTAIQRYLWENRDQLLAHGVDYLQVTPPQLHLPRYANADFLFDENTRFDEVQRLIDTSPADRIVISEEGLWGRPRVILNPAFEGYEKTVVIYLRNSADLIASWAAENSEPYNALVVPPKDLPPGFLSGPLPINVGLDQCRFYYGKIFSEFFVFLDSFLAAGGHIVVRPFETDRLIGRDATLDFLDVLKVHPAEDQNADQKRDLIKVNPSRSRKFCDVSAAAWKLVQARGDEEFYGLALVEAVYAACRSGDDRPVVATLPDELLESIEEEFRFVEPELSARSAQAGQDILARKMPSVFGQDRPPLAPIDEREVELLVDREITRLRTERTTAGMVRLESELDQARAALATALAERDHARASLPTAQTELDRLRAALAATAADLDEARAALAATSAALDEQPNAALATALAERDRARRYPWKYVKHAVKIRLKKH
jgi:hypothetical protein